MIDESGEWRLGFGKMGKPPREVAPFGDAQAEVVKARRAGRPWCIRTAGQMEQVGASGPHRHEPRGFTMHPQTEVVAVVRREFGQVPHGQMDDAEMGVVMCGERDGERSHRMSFGW